MSAAEEALRAELWQAEQEAIAARRAYYQSLLAGDPEAAQALYADWQAFQLALQEARDHGEQILNIGYRREDHAA